MATIVLDVQDESLLTQTKKACQLLKGVASVKVVSKREKSQACLNSSEREQAQAELKMSTTPEAQLLQTQQAYEKVKDNPNNTIKLVCIDATPKASASKI